MNPRSIFRATLFSIFLISCQKDNDVVDNDPADVDIPENKVPVVDAGSPITITLPVNTATLTGTGNDSDGSVVAYLWSQVSGPSSATIAGPGSPSTSVKGFVQGKYIFQLMAVDNKGATGVDTTSITVNP